MIGINSDRLRDNKKKIISLWEERALKEVSSAGTLPSLALRNSLPIYLDHLSEALATNRKMDVKSVFSRDQEAVRIGKQHGASRASNRNYELTEVIFEYHILREVIFNVLETDGPLVGVQRDIIYDSIEQSVNDAAVRFSEIHKAIQQKFVNTLSHDLKTPISAAKMNAELILMSCEILDPSANSAKRIIGSMNRLDTMINDLLDAGRLRAGEQLSLQFAQCNLDKVVREVVDEMSVIHGDRFILNSKAAVIGNWSCNGLRRAVENLVGNAVKYSTPQTPVTISLNQGKTSVEVAVHNQGPPIAEKEIPLLFQDYQRSKSAREGAQTGWGLGLTLVKGVVDAHKGKVRVESAEGKGTSFIFEIPCNGATADGDAGRLRSA